MCHAIPLCYSCAMFFHNQIICQTMSWWAPQLRSQPCDTICRNILLKSFQRAPTCWQEQPTPSLACGPAQGSADTGLCCSKGQRGQLGSWALEEGEQALPALAYCHGHTQLVCADRTIQHWHRYKTGKSCQTKQAAETRTVNPNRGQCLLDQNQTIITNNNTQISIRGGEEMPGGMLQYIVISQSGLQVVATE